MTGGPIVSREALNDRSVVFIEGVQSGLSGTAAARAAGYADPAKQSKRLMKNPQIQRVLSLLTKFNTGAKKKTRDELHDMLMESFDIAKIQADAGSMVRVVAEFNRMNGFYEPETRKVDISIRVNQQKEVIQQLSDEELLEMIGGDVLEGEYAKVLDEEM